MEALHNNASGRGESSPANDPHRDHLLHVFHGVHPGVHSLHHSRSVDGSANGQFQDPSRIAHRDGADRLDTAVRFSSGSIRRQIHQESSRIHGASAHRNRPLHLRFRDDSSVLVEIRRLKVARQHGLLDDPTAVVPLSVFWQVPQFCLVGASEVFGYIGIYEFFYVESPDAMRGLGTAFAMLTTSFGMFLSSVLLTLVTRITTRNGAPGWIADNLNRGHLDYFFWLLAAMSAVNLVLFVVCAKWYTTMQQWRPASKPVSRPSSPPRLSD